MKAQPRWFNKDEAQRQWLAQKNAHAACLPCSQVQGESQAQDLDMRVLQMMSQSRHVFLANTVTPVGDVSASRRFYFDALLNQMVTDLRGAKVFSYRHLKTTTSGCMIDGRIDGEQLEELRHWVAARQEAGVLRNVEWQA